MSKTLSIIKPDGIKKNLVGKIYQRFYLANLKIIAAKMLCLSVNEAEMFYKEHKDQFFFKDLVAFMSSSPIMIQVLSGDKDVVDKHRLLMGVTNPKFASPGTIRYDFASSILCNVVHGSDSINSATREINFFFSELEIF